MALQDFAKSLSSSLAGANLVPGSASNLIPDAFEPSIKLNITFGEKEVNLGNLLRVTDVKTVPAVSFAAEVGEPDAAYMLMLVDPDAPTPDDPKFAFWRHWVQPGLQPLNDAEGMVGQPEPALTQYLAPGPKDDSKPHRYLFLLFRQPDGLRLSKEDVGGEEFVDRRSFDAATFIQKNQLRLVGMNWMLGAGDGWKE